MIYRKYPREKKLLKYLWHSIKATFNYLHIDIPRIFVSPLHSFQQTTTFDQPLFHRFYPNMLRRQSVSFCLCVYNIILYFFISLSLSLSLSLSFYLYLYLYLYLSITSLCM